MNEVMQQYGIYFSPTDKVNNKKEHGLSLIKDQLIHNLVVISEECTHLYEEMEKYAKDLKGNIPKKNDHLIDCYRYLNASANYNMLEALEAIKEKSDPMERKRFRRVEDISDVEDDWTLGIFTDF